jgi:hypothetical protein
LTVEAGLDAEKMGIKGIFLLGKGFFERR